MAYCLLTVLKTLQWTLCNTSHSLTTSVCICWGPIRNLDRFKAVGRFKNGLPVYNRSLTYTSCSVGRGTLPRLLWVSWVRVTPRTAHFFSFYACLVHQQHLCFALTCCLFVCLVHHLTMIHAHISNYQCKNYPCKQCSIYSCKCCIDIQWLTMMSLLVVSKYRFS